MAFENITKGEWVFIEDEKGSPIISLEEHENIATVNDCNNFGNCDHETAKANAEFICFCGNLQQKLDISCYEEVVKALEEIKSMCDGNVTNENNIWHKCNKVLTKAKRQ